MKIAQYKNIETSNYRFINVEKLKENANLKLLFGPKLKANYNLFFYFKDKLESSLILPLNLWIKKKHFVFFAFEVISLVIAVYIYVIFCVRLKQSN